MAAGRYRSRSSFGSHDTGDGAAAPTWKNRANFLTRAFDAIGVGKTVRLTYYRPADNGKGMMLTADYKVELAPPDLESAPRWQNRKLGLTVKDVTYEVRHALNLKDPPGVIVAKAESGSPMVIARIVKDMTYEIRHALSLTDADPGVLVAKVEDGSPMTVARIYPNEIITRLDDKPLGSARQMRDLVAAARKAGRQKVRLTVLRLGRTRLADLDIAGYDPADDEGIGED